MYNEINKFFEEKKIVEALSSYSMYLGDSPYKLPGFFSILPYGELQYGLWMPKGGMYGLVEGLIKLNQEKDVKINTSSKIKKIIVEKKSAIGVILEDGSEILSDIIVSNVDSETTHKDLIGINSKKYKMTPSAYTFYWGINKTINSLTHHTIFLPDNFKKTFDELFIKNEIPNDLPFYISIPSKTDSSLAPKGQSSLFALIPCPVISKFSEEHNIEKAFELKNEVFNRFEQNDIDIKKEDIIFEKIYTPHEWKNNFGLFDGSAFGPSHNFSQIGPFRNSNKSKKIKNLYFVGASTTPGTGVPMCILSSKMTNEIIQEELHK
jgi:phytoene desaturase